MAACASRLTYYVCVTVVLCVQTPASDEHMATLLQNLARFNARNRLKVRPLPPR